MIERIRCIHLIPAVMLLSACGSGDPKTPEPRRDARPSSIEFRTANAAGGSAITSMSREELRAMRGRALKKKAFADILERVEAKARRSGLLKADESIMVFWDRGRKRTEPRLPHEFMVVGPPFLNCSRFKSSHAAVSPNSGYYYLNIRLDGAGKETLSRVTRANLNKPIAIVVEGRVLMNPVIRTPITQGGLMLAGAFSRKDIMEIWAVVRGCSGK